MKANRIKLLVFLTLSITSIVSAQNLLQQPESVVYDPARDRYLVSNVTSGNIVAIDNEGNQSYFSTALSGHSTLGLHIKDDRLYVVVNNGAYAGVVGFSLETAEIAVHFDIEYNGMLNDITSDSEGNLYISDYPDSKIYKINPASESWWIFVSQGLSNPNGIWYDSLGERILAVAVTAPGGPIMAVSLEDSTVSLARCTYLYGLDGITMDGEANIYVSDWGTHSVYRFDYSLMNPGEVISGNHIEPADIFFDTYNNILAVPNYYQNTVGFIPIQLKAGESSSSNPNEFMALRNFPNPFNASTSICFTLNQKLPVSVLIYNQLGREISQLEIRNPDLGENRFLWNAEGLTSGIYFIRLDTQAGFSESLKVILIR